MAFAGLRGTGSWGADERPKQFREMILFLRPNGIAPLFALTSKARTEKLTDPEFSWWDETLDIARLATAGTYSDTDNTITLNSAITGATAGGLDLVVGDIVMVEKTELAAYDNELMVVSSITSDTVVVFKRGQAGSTAAAFGSSGVNIFLTKVSSAFREGADAPGVSQRNPTKRYNLAQIFRTAIGQTGTTMETKARTGDAWKNDKTRKSFDHSRDIEFSLLFGQRNETTESGYPKRYTGGLRQFITTNVTVFTTTPTTDTFLNATYKVFDFDSDAGDERIAYCGNGFLNSLNKMVADKASTTIQYDGIVNLYGQNLRRYTFPQGSIAFKTHPLLNRHGRYTNSAFIVDPTNILWRPLRDTKLRDNIQDNKSDSKQAEWLTEGGFEIQHEKTMAYIGNFVV